MANTERGASDALDRKTSQQRTGTRQVNRLGAGRLRMAKPSFSVRRTPVEAFEYFVSGDVKPKAGDLVLARIDRIFQHTRLQLRDGRRTRLFPGDEIIVTYGNRYAPRQFEAVVPESLEPCHLVAAGGIAAKALSWHDRLRPPTEISPLGIISDQEGNVFNLKDWTIEPGLIQAHPRPVTFAVVGTSMNAGKTTTASWLIKGLIRAGMKVAGAKVTGTGAGGDYWYMKDAGADPVIDFTDAGYASTYLVSERDLEQIFTTLVGNLQQQEPDAIVLEIADGILQDETSALLSLPIFAPHVDGILFAAQEALGAQAGVEWLREWELPVLAVSGMVSASPLGSREAEIATGLPVLRKEQLADPVELSRYLLRPEFRKQG